MLFNTKECCTMSPYSIGFLDVQMDLQVTLNNAVLYIQIRYNTIHAFPFVDFHHLNFILHHGNMYTHV